MIKLIQNNNVIPYNKLTIGEMYSFANEPFNPLLCCYDELTNSKFLVNLETGYEVIGPENMSYHVLKITKDMEVEYL